MIRINHIRTYCSICILSVFVLGWLFAACSTPSFIPVQLSEEERIRYDFDFIEGTKFKMLGNLPAAANLLTRCTEVNPYDAAAHFQLADIYSMVDDDHYALKHARLAVRYDTENEWYKLLLANLYLNVNYIDSAIVVYRQIVDDQPENVELQYNLAFLYLENNKFRRALRILNRIERTYGFTEDVAIAKYKLHSRRNDDKSIETVLKRAINSFPDELRFYGLLAEHYSMIGRERDADEYYTKLLEVDPENAIAFISMIEFYKDYGKDVKALEEMQRMFNMKSIDPELKVELFFQISADSAFFRKHQQEMDLLIKLLFESYPDNFRVRLVNTDRNMRERNYEGARDDLLFITNRVQTNYFLWEHLFHLLYLLNDSETLYETTAQALQYFDDRFLFHFFHGFSATMLKKYDKAIPAYYKTLELLEKERDPDRDIEFQAYIFLGEACNEQRRFAESDLAFENALRMSPNNPVILNNYSYYLSLREERLDLAEQYIKRSVAMEPDNSAFLDTYGWVLYKLGRIDEAIIMVEKAIENGGNESPEIIKHYCELLTVSGRIDEARIICQQSIEMSDSDETVEEKMASFMNDNN